MTQANSINFALNPVLDIAKFNKVIETMKDGMTNMNPLDSDAIKKSLKSLKPDFVGLVGNATDFAKRALRSGGRCEVFR